MDSAFQPGLLQSRSEFVTGSEQGSRRSSQASDSGNLLRNWSENAPTRAETDAGAATRRNMQLRDTYAPEEPRAADVSLSDSFLYAAVNVSHEIAEEAHDWRGSVPSAGAAPEPAQRHYASQYGAHSAPQYAAAAAAARADDSVDEFEALEREVQRLASSSSAGAGPGTALAPVPHQQHQQHAQHQQHQQHLYERSASSTTNTHATPSAAASRRASGSQHPYGGQVMPGPVVDARRSIGGGGSGGGSRAVAAGPAAHPASSRLPTAASSRLPQSRTHAPLHGSSAVHAHPHAASAASAAAVVEQEVPEQYAEAEDGGAAAADAEAAAAAAAQEQQEAAVLDTTGLSEHERALTLLVRSKVAALQEKMQWYTNESSKLAAAQKAVNADRARVEEERKAVGIERAEVRAWKEAEAARLEAWKEDLASKMEKEKRVAVRQAKAAAAAASALPDRKEREEMESLRASVGKLKADLAAAEARYRSSVERHRGVQDKLQARITELEGQVAAYEAERIQLVFGAPSGGVNASATARQGSRATAAAATATAATTVLDASALSASSLNRSRVAGSTAAAAATPAVKLGAPAQYSGAGGGALGGGGGEEEAHSKGATAAAAAAASREYNPNKYTAAAEAASVAGSETGSGVDSLSGGGRWAEVPMCVQLRYHLCQRWSAAALSAGVHTATDSAGAPIAVVQQRVLDNGKVELRYADGSRVVRFRNGTEKETGPDGSVVVRFSNGDIKRTQPLSSVPGAPTVEHYYYASAATLQTTYSAAAAAFVSGGGRDGASSGSGEAEAEAGSSRGFDCFHFPSGQIELHWHKEGETSSTATAVAGVDKEILFPDGTLKRIEGGGTAVTVFAPDGAIYADAT